MYLSYDGFSTIPSQNIASDFIRGDGNLWTTEVNVNYENENERPVNGGTIMEFRNDKIVQETLYFAYPFEPPEWRSQWVEIVKDNK